MPQITARSDAERDAYDHVQELKGVYTHLAMFAVVILCLTGLTLDLTPQYFWVAWAALGWGIAAHAITVIDVVDLFGPEWERRQIENRLNHR